MKKIKMILPVIAILFAASAAFVSNASPKSLSIIPVASETSECTKIGTCDTSVTGTLCRVDAGLSNLYNKLQSCQAFNGEGDFVPNP